MKPLLVLFAVALPACHPSPLAGLREAFNRESGHTRVLALLSPT